MTVVIANILGADHKMRQQRFVVGETITAEQYQHVRDTDTGEVYGVEVPEASGMMISFVPKSIWDRVLEHFQG